MGSDGQQLSAESFGALLLAAGAEARYATPAWVANHFRWVAWKLACYERAHPRCLAGRMLTAPIVLDQLLYRRACHTLLGPCTCRLSAESLLSALQCEASCCLI